LSTEVNEATKETTLLSQFPL